MRRILGLDIGGVIIDVPTRLDAETWTILRHRFLEIPPVAPFSQMRRVIERFDRTYLISAASDDEVERSTRSWLHHHGFWSSCDVSSKDLLFCRYGWQKAEVLRGIGERLALFVDDRMENLVGLASHVDCPILYDRGEGEAPSAEIAVVRSWEDLLRFS